MPIQVSSVLQLSCTWTVKEKRNGIMVPVLERKNVFTNFGLSALASAVSGGYAPPIYLSIDNSFTTMAVQGNIGDTSVQVTNALDVSGDTQLVLGLGLASQETVTFTSKSGTGPFTYVLSSALANTHLVGDPVVRQVNVNDTMANVISPVQYDSVSFPNQNAVNASSYSQGVGNWIIQFYFTATQAVAQFMTIGLVDSVTIGQGNLHNHVNLGYNHTAGTNDCEIDGNLTIVNA